MTAALELKERLRLERLSKEKMSKKYEMHQETIDYNRHVLNEKQDYKYKIYLKKFSPKKVIPDQRYSPDQLE